MNIIRNIKGTHDILPSETKKWQNLEKIVRKSSQLFGFEENETATLEGYMQDYFGRILRKLKELSDEKEKSL